MSVDTGADSLASKSKPVSSLTDALLTLLAHSLLFSPEQQQHRRRRQFSASPAAQEDLLIFSASLPLSMPANGDGDT